MTSDLAERPAPGAIADTEARGEGAVEIAA